MAEDRESHAILIEHSLPGTSLSRYFENDPAGCIAPAIEVLRSILRPPPANMTDVGTLDNWFENFSRYVNTDFPKKDAAKAFEIYERLSRQPGTFYLHGDFHPGNIVSSTRAPFLAIDPKGIVGHIGYDIAVFLNNLHWWQKGDSNVDVLLDDAVERFAKELDFREKELREWAFAGMVIGAWWNFDDMPDLYDGDVAITEVWRV